MALFTLTIGIAGCGDPSPTDDLAGVPLSTDLRLHLETSRRSLRAGERGDRRVKLDLDRYHGFGEMFNCPQRRLQAEDSLFSLWEADLEHPLWPDLAAFHWDYFRQPARFDSMFSEPGFPDSSTAVGAYLREYQEFKSAPGGEDFSRAWALREDLDPFQSVWLTLRMSRQMRMHGQADQGIRLTLELLPTARDLGGWRLEMEVWLEVARALRVGDHLDDALHAIRMAEDLAEAVARQTGNAFIVPWVRLAHAEVRAARFEIEPALDLYASCVDSALAHEMPTFAGVCLNYAGIFTAGCGRYEEGLRFYQQGLGYALADQDSMSIPVHLSNIARRYRLLGEPDSCFVYLREAERWIDAYPDLSNRAFFPLHQAEYYALVGDFVTVDSLLAVATSLHSHFSSIEKLAELHLQLIKQGMERGRPAQAYRSIALLDSLRGRLDTISADRNELFDLHLASAEFLARQGLYARAADELACAYSMLERRPDPSRRWEYYRAQGDLARRREDPTLAEEAYRACLFLSEERGDESRLADSRLLLGSALLDQGRFAEVHGLFPDETDKAFGGRFRTRLSALLLTAVAESRAGRYQDAWRTLERARVLANQDSPQDLLARLDLEAGRVLAGQGEDEAARGMYARAAECLNRELDHMPLDSRVFFDSDLRRELAEAMLVLKTENPKRAVRGPEAQGALLELTTLLPAWQRPEVPDAGGFAEPQIIYFVGDGSSFRWTIVDGEISLIRLAGEDSLLTVLAPVIADFKQPTRSPVSGELAALTETLGGAPSGWRAGGSLAIVCDGPLFSVPWAALPMENGADRVWIDQGPVVLADAPTFEAGRSSPARNAPPRLLALGVDGGDGRLGAGLEALHHAEREARDIYELWPAGHADLRVGTAADWRALDAEELSMYAVIHIASHALAYQGMADKTTMLLAGSGGDPLTSAEIGQLDLNADLVFLSCCEAAEGVRRGVGPAHAGLARSFLSAGAGAVIAPCTRVEDEAARDLAERFYQHWLLGLPVEAALQRAQLDIRDRGPKWTHPYYWAFYQAIGQ